jgi:DNA modification methylase
MPKFLTTGRREQSAVATRPRARHRTTPRLAVAPTVELVPLESLTPLTENPRQHGPRDLGYLEEVLQRVGAARSGVIDEDGVVLAGNGVRAAAMQAGFRQALIVDADGQTPVFVRRRGLTARQKDELIVADNQAAALSGWDLDVLQAYADRHPDVRKGWTDDEWAALLLRDAAEVKAGRTDPDEVPEERPTGIVAGDLFELGSHRLLCSDSRETDAVETVMGGALADGLWTDPPFGVSYIGKTSEALVVHGDRESDLAPLLREAFAAADRVLTPGAAIYVAHPAGRNAVVFGHAFLAVGWHFHQGLVWVKDSMVLGHSDFHYQHECIIYGWKKGATRTWLSDRTQVTIFAIDRPKASRDHPTSKPVELVVRQIGNNVPTRGVIFEPFGGSGTTLIAAEQLGISCRAIELSPAYCQVIIDRFEAFSGHTATKAGEAVRA